MGKEWSPTAADASPSSGGLGFSFPVSFTSEILTGGSIKEIRGRPLSSSGPTMADDEYKGVYCTEKELKKPSLKHPIPHTSIHQT